MTALVSSRRGPTLAAALLLAALLPVCSPALAQWPTHPDSGGLAVSTAPNYQWYEQAIEDGTGGLFVVWRDDRNVTGAQPSNYDVYAQHLSASGVPLWGAGGVAVCANLAMQDRPALCGDGAGGLFVAWSDSRTGNNDIWAQHLNASGAPLWVLDGQRAARLDAADDAAPAMASDGAGGFVVTWQSYDPAGVPAGTRVRAQRVNGAGFAQWTSAGMAISPLSGSQTEPRVVGDSAGGAVLSWVQSTTPRCIRAQRLNAAGARLWSADGIAVTDTTRAASRTHYLLAGPAGGARFLVHDTAIIPTPRWRDVDGSGATLRWDALLPMIPWGEIMTSVCAGDSGTALIATTNGGYESVQRLAADGTLDWSPHGLPVSPNTQFRTMYLSIARDGDGGAYLFGTAIDPVSNWFEVRGQHVRWNGTMAWAVPGRTLGNAVTGDQRSPLAFSSGQGAIAVWQDERAWATRGVDLYAQRVDSTGLLPDEVLDAPTPPVAARVSLSAPWPNPARAGEPVTLRYSLPATTRVTLSLHDVAGRRVATLAAGERAAGEHRVTIDRAGSLSPGLYLARLATADGVAVTRRLVLIR